MFKFRVLVTALILCAAVSSVAFCTDNAQPSSEKAEANPTVSTTQVSVSVVVTTAAQAVPGAVVVASALPAASGSVAANSPAPVVLAKPSDPGKPYTSVIIDTTGYKLDRCMSPKIRRSDGSEIWGTVKVDYDFVEDTGIVGYAKDMDGALKCSRCGANPMIIKAIGIAGGNFKSDPVISNEDAALLLAENTKSGFLEKFNLIFIKDGKL